MKHTRAVSKRKMLVLLLVLAANLLFSRVEAKAQDSSLGTDDFWTTVGSAGAVDEEDLGIVDLADFFVGHKAGQTGTVNIRYNIVAVEGANQEGMVIMTPGFVGGVPCTTVVAGDGCDFNGAHQIRVRYRDSDGHAPNVRVAFSIWRTNIMTGLDENIYTFDSNVDGANTGVGQTFTGTDCETKFDFDFDFSQYFFWIDAELTRSSATGIARLSAIQITELPTSCSPKP